VNKMNLELDLVDETSELTDENIQFVADLLNHAAKMENVEEGTEVSVTFVTNEEIREINKQYRDKDSATDVISFALEELSEGEVVPVGMDMPRVLGDIIISVERTREQAEEYGHTFERELGFLAVHGFLHLLGYDHMTEEDEKEMFGRQKDILDAYGLSR